MSWTHPKTGKVYSLSLEGSARVDEATLDACFALVEETSRADYEASAHKWRPAEKRREMREPDMRYIVVREKEEKASEGDFSDDDDDVEGSTAGTVRAFTSLMPTYEQGQPVVYCYEIHLKPDIQGTGLGALLLGFQSIVAHNMSPPITKVMLTCFLSNAHALRFYHKQGFAVDDVAPAERKLRGGKVFVPDYTILSKPVVRE